MLVRSLGTVDYVHTYERMQEFTKSRSSDTPDELWLCQHLPTFTQGLAGKPEHILKSHSIPVVQSNRGGQITYHGPGQIVAYPLVDLRRLGIFIKEYVYRLEEAIIKTLLNFGVTGHRVPGAPGVYVQMNNPFGHNILKFENSTSFDASSEHFKGLGKIAALGIKVSDHKTYHGLALNVEMDLSPYSYINPCGYKGLNSIDLFTIGVKISLSEVSKVLEQKLITYLSN
jgi:lipoyl(octanoyl) transferase